MTGLETKVNQLSGIGKTISLRLKRLGIETIGDLIFYYPFRYDDFSQLTTIDQLKSGSVTTVKVRMELLANRRTFRKKKIITEGVASDSTGSIKVIWFNQPWIAKNIKVGEEIYLSGKVAGNLFDIYLNSPLYERAAAANLNTARLVPIYSITEGVSQKQLRALVKIALNFVGNVSDFLPEKIVKQERLLSLPLALKQIHFPENHKKLAAARTRLAFEELFLLQLWSQLIKKELDQKTSWPVVFQREKIKEFIDGLDFKLTTDQKKAAWEIIQDLEKKRPMNRLLEGDVGSGKTLVAALAIFNTALNGYQSVLLAPTEILARQHFQTFDKLFKNKDLKIGLLTRSNKLINQEEVGKKEFLARCRAGKIQIIIGTHAVIQKEVAFAKLALAVIDEQHRFGVDQRQILKKQSEKTPHFLSLSATPIPRSLALIIYGSLDLSIIKQLPPGRRPVITKVVAPENRQLAYEFISKKITEGRQVMVICPLIDPSDKLGVRSVTEEFKKLDQEVFPHLPVGLLHGRLKASNKEKVMAEFVADKIKILVATSVVEVGVDVPNATVIMIEGAERFGLAQLHQFRGRVGRGREQSYCFLFSASPDQETAKRLSAVTATSDGFILAQKDLQLRGAGQIYGYRQSGFDELKIANLDDLPLIKKARFWAEKIINDDCLDKYPLLLEKIEALGLTSHLE